MKISELITELENKKVRYGDIDVCIFDETTGYNYPLINANFISSVFVGKNEVNTGLDPFVDITFAS